jgi:hypothetical protein
MTDDPVEDAAREGDSRDWGDSEREGIEHFLWESKPGRLLLDYFNWGDDDKHKGRVYPPDGKPRSSEVLLGALIRSSLPEAVELRARIEGGNAFEDTVNEFEGA